MGKNEMPKAYEPKEYETPIYSAWEESGFFNPDKLPGERKESFTIMLPPPNVTGTLHMGHAVMLAIEDILTRFNRMRGKRALWVPGTDHAAIATQAKVEKNLIKSGLKDPRRELGREVFLKHVDTFAKESHDTIVNQMKKMGCSVDWSREAFTLDEARSRAVNEAFRRMHADGLIYRGDKVVNWCPRCASTLSDDELEHKETNAKLYTFRYDKDFPIKIATTRPETKVGDTAVAVNPSDERYAKLIGKEFNVNFLGKALMLKVIGDEGVDPGFGTGALGVTPAHSKVDAEMAEKNGVPLVQVISEDGLMLPEAGKLVAGLPVRDARKKITDQLREAGLMEEEKDIAQNLSICYRCDTPVEPLPKRQWFIDVQKPFAFRQSSRNPIKGLRDGQELTLKEIMQHVVREQEIAIIPERFEKTYFHWIDNLRDWNISRQIWYGHRVPVWYKEDELFVGKKPEGEGWTQDEDTLDTWFSSGLWTISALGWPDATDELALHHPTSVLETGYDILFFWVARMILMTTYAVGEVPFKTVYLHGLVRDEEGRKMSKSLDNIIDPLEMIAEYGADATRLSLVIGATPGNDMKLSVDKIAAYRNFTNKLWNISRFVLTTVESREQADTVEAVTLADAWILSRFNAICEEVTNHLEKYEISAAGELLREFTWSEFADWYLEIAKIQREEYPSSTDAILLSILERLLTLWHPFMPFVTEQIYKEIGKEEMLLIGSWPALSSDRDKVAEKSFEAIRAMIVSVRNLRAQYKIEPKQLLSAVIIDAEYAEMINEQAAIIKQLARLESLTVSKEGDRPASSASVVLGSAAVYLPLEGVVDIEKEKARLKKEAEELQKYLSGLEGKLNNEGFLQNAPADVVESLKEKQQEALRTVSLIEDQLTHL